MQGDHTKYVINFSDFNRTEFTRPWSTLFEFSGVWWRYTWFDRNHRFCRTIWRRYWILLRNCFHVKRSEIRIASRYCAGNNYYVCPVVMTGTMNRWTYSRRGFILSIPNSVLQYAFWHALHVKTVPNLPDDNAWLQWTFNLSNLNNWIVAVSSILSAATEDSIEWPHPMQTFGGALTSCW